ncbi:AMT [Cordylochernes scorpioides]|uniref:Aminomethyltransferase n=1 Tax=Cordylochernes scorpioides TaxID=51811 RepID=A0ABY6KA20_9ARAC|nr:AMT [Cordylochernes scorpioides]
MAELTPGQGTLTLFTNNRGGIMDDLIVTRTTEDHLYVVSNAGCREKDLHHLMTGAEKFRAQGNDVHVEQVEDRALIALQGPAMAGVLQSHTSADLSSLHFMTSTLATLCGVPDCRVTRCGYTGEDGVELSVPASKACHIVETLLQHEDVKLAGLGARDSLRLEAGLCLYGHDISEDTTPVEASLAWTIGKRRRTEANFPGADVILAQLKNKPEKRRVGLKSTGAVPREGTQLQTEAGQSLGSVTSGCPSPELKTNIAMAYVPRDMAKVGTGLLYVLRNKTFPAQVAKMPFVPTKYYLKK